MLYHLKDSIIQFHKFCTHIIISGARMVWCELTKCRSKYITDARLQWCHITSLYYKNTNSTCASVLHVTDTLKF